MPIFESSSRKRRDYDGLISVYCRECGRFITRTYVRSDNKAICALCERVLSGKPLTAEAIEQYEKSTIANQDISMLNMSKYDKGPSTFKLRTMGGRIMQALGIAKAPTPELESTKIAKSKRRPRIFADVQPGQQSDKAVLGSMEQLNTELERQRQKL